MPSSSFWATARQPQWITMLVLSLVLATVFVVLSAWQFDQSRTEHSYAEDTETPVELTAIYEPERPIGLPEADRIVNLTGEFVPETDVLIADRLQDGEDGYWAVAAFRVDAAPDEQVIPVVRGWTADIDEGLSPAPEGQLSLQGRLLPTEAPGPGPRDLPYPVLPTLSVAELINLWGEDSYSGFVVDFSEEALGASSLASVWVGPQPEGSDINWLNLFYAVEWVVFAGFAFYLWWRLVKDAHERQLEEERLDREWAEQWRAEQLEKQRQQTEHVEETT
ncbi:SURF1 family protein [Nesterenkonia haasae]|uniref:SURF1 family protein n=1 Tax=Nesterenkonia haasae TaxID=2587813 RepID=UPI00139110A2|nr:SURF1 family protein [Nesterenkonia haasae]